MQSILDNLVLYEVVLLFLGIFLFVILSGGLIYYIVKKEEIKKLLAFFLIPIVMIAYPSIREIQIGDNKLIMNQKIEEVLKNPADKVAITKLLKATRKVESRAKSVTDLTAVSKSYYILGDSEKAIYYANMALKKTDVKNVKTTSKGKISEVDNATKEPLVPKNNYKIIELKNLKTLANIQKEIKKNPKLLKDTVVINKKLRLLKLKNKTAYKKFIKQN